MASGGDIDDGFVRVASFSDLSVQRKICVKVEDRNIAVFYVNDSVYALDLFCYRKNIFGSQCSVSLCDSDFNALTCTQKAETQL